MVLSKRQRHDTKLWGRFLRLAVSHSYATIFFLTEMMGRTLVEYISFCTLTMHGLAAKNIEESDAGKAILRKQFEIRNVKAIAIFPSIQISRDRRKHTLSISHEGHLKNVTNNFRLTEGFGVNIPMEVNLNLDLLSQEEDNKNQFPYRERVGCLMYLAVTTRPDIMLAASRLVRYCSKTVPVHWKVAKNIVRYLKHTADLGIVYGDYDVSTVTGYCDADWGGDRRTRRSTSGYVIVGNNGVFSWKSCSQKVFASSTLEAEYISQALCMNALWVHNML